MDIGVFSYFGKSIPITYDHVKIQSRLDEAELMLSKAKEYLSTLDIS